MVKASGLAWVAVALWLGPGGCSQAPPTSASIEGTSRTLLVRGRYEPVALDRIARIAIEEGRLVLYGTTTSTSMALPGSAAPDEPRPPWALVTEGASEKARVLTFTHAESLDDFTIELPASDAPLRYGALAGPGHDVLILAWGEASQSYWGWVTIERAPPSGR